MLPVDYAFDGHAVIVRVGEGLFDRLVGRLVAFQVDGIDDRTQASVDGRSARGASSSEVLPPRWIVRCPIRHCPSRRWQNLAGGWCRSALTWSRGGGWDRYPAIPGYPGS